MSLMNEFEEKERYIIEQMVYVHLYTKKYLLIAEEIAEEGELFLQPLKEHRDAFDHIMRCYSVILSDSSITDEKKYEYIKKNLEKAFGHVYRAFFDTADWLTYILRKWIRIKLINVGDKECIKKLDNYEQIKKNVNEIPMKVATLRETKDVAKLNNREENTIIEEVDEYIKILDTLIEIRRQILLALGP